MKSGKKILQEVDSVIMNTDRGSGVDFITVWILFYGSRKIEILMSSSDPIIESPSPYRHLYTFNQWQHLGGFHRPVLENFRNLDGFDAKDLGWYNDLSDWCHFNKI